MHPFYSNHNVHCFSEPLLLIDLVGCVFSLCHFISHYVEFVLVWCGVAGRVLISVTFGFYRSKMDVFIEENAIKS